MKRSTVLLLPLLALPARGQSPALQRATPEIDEKAKALLARNEDAMFALKSYAATCWTTLSYPPSAKQPDGIKRYELATLTAVKPNLMRYDGWEVARESDAAKKREETPTFIFTSDGKQGVNQFGNTYRPMPDTSPERLSTILEPWGGFYTKANSINANFRYHEETEKTLTLLRALGPDNVEGMACDVIEYAYSSEYNNERQDYRGKYYFGRDGLVRRQRETVVFGGKSGYTRDAVLRDLRTDFPMPDAKQFVYTPPPGVKSEEQAAKDRPRLLAAGIKAPDFTANDRDGKPVKLSDFRGKVVVIDFWATWCGPCMAALPDTNAVAAKYRDRGLVVLGVNVWDEADAFKTWLPKHPEYGAVRFLLDPNGNNGKDIARTLYNVSGIPTQYVIDRSGVIRAAYLGARAKEALEHAVEGLL